MKLYQIKDGVQIAIALLMTGSMAFAMQPTVSQDSQSLQTAVQSQEAKITQVEPQSPPNVQETAAETKIETPAPAPEKVATWEDNPQNCDQSKQYIAAEAPFNCIEKPQGTVVTATNSVPTATGSHTDWMAAAGISSQEYAAADYIISKESGWNHTVWNSAGSGAYGLCQALPANKMSTAGSDWQDNPITQLRWCNQYAKARYGGWWGAYNFWVANHYW